MTEQATVFWRMIFRQGRDLVRSMAFCAEFFSLLFTHVHEPFMVFIMRQVSSCFGRGIPEKEEQAATDEYKYNIIDNNLFFVAINIKV